MRLLDIKAVSCTQHGLSEQRAHAVDCHWWTGQGDPSFAGLSAVSASLAQFGTREFWTLTRSEVPLFCFNIFMCLALGL